MTSRRAILDAYEHRLEVHVGGAEPIVIAVSVAVADQAALADASRAALGGESLTDVKQLDVRWHAPLVQQRTLTNLPPVSTRDLVRLIENHVDRFFRPVVGEVVVTADWTSRDRTEARAAVCSLALLQRLEKGLADCGRRVRMHVAADSRDMPQLRFVTPGARARQRARSIAIGAAGAILASSGWFVAGATYLLDLHADDRAIGAELARLREPLARIDALMASVSEFAPVAEAVRRQSADVGWVADRLGGVATALPSDTHLHRFTVSRDGTFVVTAHGPDALDAVERLDAWWPGVVRLDDAPRVLDESSDTPRTEVFTVALDGRP